jgi:hypothetical protein
VYSLVGTFGLASPAPNVLAMDGIIDLTFFEPLDVPPFWQFQAGGCNQLGLAITGGRPAGCDSGTNSQTLCGSDGTECGAFITGYGFGSDINFPPNRARLLIALGRAYPNVVVLPASATATDAHFAFELHFYMDNAPNVDGEGCLGCYSGVNIKWTEAVLYNPSSPNRPEGIAAFLTDLDPGSGDAGVVANPGVLPARPTTWGQLKTLYR